MKGLPVAHFLAAAGAVVAIPLTWRCKLVTAFENEVPSAIRWNEVRVTENCEIWEGGCRVVDCCAGSEVHDTFSRYPTLWDLSVSGPRVGAGTRGDADDRDALRGYSAESQPSRTNAYCSDPASTSAMSHEAWSI